MAVSIQTADSIELGIRVTPDAEHRIVTYLKEHRVSNLRLWVKKTGCSGWSYKMDYVRNAQPDDLTFPLSGDRLICVEKASYPYLKGLIIDYVKQGIQSKFVFRNPNQTGECGCGESFSVEK